MFTVDKQATDGRSSPKTDGQRTDGVHHRRATKATDGRNVFKESRATYTKDGQTAKDGLSITDGRTVNATYGRTVPHERTISAMDGL